MSAARALSKSMPSVEPHTGWTIVLTGAALGDRFGRRWMCPLVTAACG